MAVQFSLSSFYIIYSLIEMLIIAVSAFIAYFSFKIYKAIKDDNYKYFSWAFSSIALSFIFKILSNITIVHRVLITRNDLVRVVFQELEWVEILNFISFILFKVFFILGFLIIFFIVTKTEKKEKVLFLYLSTVAILFSIYFNFVFHLTLVVIIAFLVNHFYKNYNKHRTTNCMLVYIAFTILLISQLSFAFTDINSIFYLLDEILLLVGFLTLVANHIIHKNSNEKTNKVGSYQRYFRGSKAKQKS